MQRNESKQVSQSHEFEKALLWVCADEIAAAQLKVLLPALQPVEVSAISQAMSIPASAKLPFGIFVGGVEPVSWLQSLDRPLPPCVALDRAAADSLARAGLVCVQCLSPNPDYLELLESLYRLGSSAETSRPAAPESADGLIAVSPAMRKLRSLLQSLRGKSVTVMINGPSGAGKELVARAVHRMSPRNKGPFVPVNCGAIPRELLESELFGHEKGAFTGAISSRAGRFEMAEGGTLFLDEVGDMPLDMQVKILRLIQERSFERVGSNKTLHADVRIIAATHRDLEAMIAAGEFREDLYYRLNVFPVAVPALAERREDIPYLIRDIARQLEEEGLGRLALAYSAEQALIAHDWAGNVRELTNLLERLLIIHPDRPIGLADLPERYRVGQAEEHWRGTEVRTPGEGICEEVNALLPEEGIDIKARIRELEIAWINEALRRNDGVVSKAALLLGLRRTTLIEKMRKYGLQS